MDRKLIVPLLLLVGGGGLGYYIYTRVTAPEVPIVPGVPPTETEPGISATYGRLSLFVPLRETADFIGALFKGGTKQKAQVEIPKEEVSPTGPSVRPGYEFLAKT